MDKKLVIIALILTIAAISAIALLNPRPQNDGPTNNVTGPREGYLHLKGGGVSQIYLLNSNISYGTYERDGYWPPWEEFNVKKGDPCVIVSGTIRNDGKEKWMALGADLFNARGEKIGTVATYSAKPWFEAVGVESNSTGTFDIRVKYNKQDVSRYDIYVWWEPTASPPP